MTDAVGPAEDVERAGSPASWRSAATGAPTQGPTWPECPGCRCLPTFQEFIRAARAQVRREDLPPPAHHGVLGNVRELSARRALKPQGGSWATPDLEFDQISPALLFVGCVPYFDVVFRHFRRDLLEIPRSRF